MQQEIKKKRVPSISAQIAAINALREELTKVSSGITENRDKIVAFYKKEREDSPKGELFKKLEELSASLKELKDARSKAFDAKNEITAIYGDMKSDITPDKTKKRPMTAAEIDEKIQEINFQLISTKITKKSEQAFSAELISLKQQRKELGAMEQKSKSVFEMKVKLDSLNAEIKDLSRAIAEKQAEIDVIKAELKTLSEQSKVKNPIVEGYERNIEALKIKKTELTDKIKAQQEEIKVKEIEHEKYLEVLAEATVVEKQKDSLRAKIAGFEAQKNVLIDEKNQLDPEKFDSVIYGIKQLSTGEDKIKVSVDLALALTKLKITIPLTKEQIPGTIASVEAKKQEFTNSIGEQVKEIESKLAKLDADILEEKKALEALPVTDARILAKIRRD